MADITTLIENDHREIERLFAAYRSPGANQDEIVGDLRTLLAQHAAAEELLVYPVVRETSSDEQADHAIDEHQEIKERLAAVDDSSSDEPDRPARIAELERAVAHHVREEEAEVLPALRLRLDRDRLDRMGELFDDIKPLLPTHPHPDVPGTATAQLLAGPLASVADRVRDLVGR